MSQKIGKGKVNGEPGEAGLLTRDTTPTKSELEEIEMENEMRKLRSRTLCIFFRGNTIAKIKSGPDLPPPPEPREEMTRVEFWRKNANNDWYRFGHAVKPDPKGGWMTDIDRHRDFEQGM